MQTLTDQTLSKVTAVQLATTRSGVRGDQQHRLLKNYRNYLNARK